jgi:hypothetical protein
MAVYRLIDALTTPVPSEQTPPDPQHDPPPDPVEH